MFSIKTLLLLPWFYCNDRINFAVKIRNGKDKYNFKKIGEFAVK